MTFKAPRIDLNPNGCGHRTIQSNLLFQGKVKTSLQMVN